MFNSIDSEVEFQKNAKVRIAENVQKLKDIRAVQIAYKSKYQAFASDFNSLMEFLRNRKFDNYTRAQVQERLKEADNLKKDANGMMNYETCWKAMRKEGPMILNVTKHLFSMHINSHHREEK